MGITDLWAVLAPAFDPRVPLSHFVAAFVAAHGRPPRIALDAYVLIHSVIDYSENPQIASAGVVRAFAAKLNALNTLNVSYVVVFDGKHKPAKLRHGNNSKQSSYRSDRSRFDKLSPKDYAEDIPVINDIKNLLLRLKVDFVQAPAEAEAECCYLQKYGVVDYVLSNDSDVFVFGGTAVLRNFKKLAADLLLAPPEPSTQEYYVTPVHLLTITQKLGLDTRRMVLLATLRGGDYSKGVEAIGIRGAVNIALCGTHFAPFFNRSPTKAEKKEPKFSEPPPDFTNALMGCFAEKSDSLLGPWTGIQLKEVRQDALKHFLRDLNHQIRLRPRDIFGRGKTFDEDVCIDEYYALLYLYPFVNRTLFKFLPGTLSFGENAADHSDLSFPHGELDDYREPFSFIRSNILFDGIVGTLNLEVRRYGTTAVIEGHDFWPSEGCNFDPLPALYVPTAFLFNMKHLVAKFLTHTREVDGLNEAIAISNSKIIDGTTLLMIKFSPLTLRDLMGIQSDLEESPTHKNSLDSIWLPESLIKWLNPEMVEAYEHEQAILQEEKRATSKKSPKKYHQATTLDSLNLTRGGLETLKAPTFGPLVKRSPKRTRAKKKPGLERGQSQILDFFGTSLDGSPKIQAVSPKNEVLGAGFKELNDDYLSLERGINLAPKLAGQLFNVDSKLTDRSHLSPKAGQRLDYSKKRSPKRPLTSDQENDTSPTKRSRGERLLASSRISFEALNEIFKTVAEKLPVSTSHPIEVIPSDDLQDISPIRRRGQKMVVLDSEQDLQLGPIQAGDILSRILQPLLDSSDGE